MELLDDKKNKRAAANVNERRRMQNINCGFEALRDLIDVPNKAKLSKSAILRHSVEMLRNVISDNQQLREQNVFLRNLHGNQINTNKTTNRIASSPIQSETMNEDSHSPPCFFNEHSLIEVKSPKRVKIDLPITTYHDNNNTPSKTFYDTFNHSIRKSPRKTNLNKFLPVSPKSVKRSSVITENYAIIGSSGYPVFESPTRRSLRLQEKEKHLLTPPSSMDSSLEYMESRDLLCSPTTRSTRLTPSRVTPSRLKNYFPPEKNIQPKNARRSLDVIIQAIDHLEKA